MRTTILLCLIVFSTSVFLSSCTTPEPLETREIYLLVDVTASAENKNHPLNLDAGKIIQLCKLDKKPKMSVKYSQSLITEVHLNQVFSIELPPINPAKFNTYKRKNKVKRFASNVEKAIKELENAKYDRKSSNIFISITNTINKVVKNNAASQLVIIQSDMLNNSRKFSVYDRKQLKKVEKSPEFLTQILEKYMPITMSLQKMEIIIVHQPNAQTDYVFRLISTIYKNYLLSKGAKSVEIVANL